MRTYFTTTPGIRESNQDRLWAAESKVMGKPAALLLVADGMGGMQCGDRAAEIALETAQRFVREVFPALSGGQAELRATIAAMFQEASRAIWEFGQAEHLDGSIGTTLVFCLAFGGRYLVANAGDSRCYYINNWEARLITEDHSRVQEMVNSGAMTAEAAERSPYRNQLTNSLGDPGDIRVDIFPKGNCYGIIDEDCALLLCSDGLYGSVCGDDLYRQLHGNHSLKDACENLVSLALWKGSTDNATVVAAEFGRLKREGRRQRRLPLAANVLRKAQPLEHGEPKKMVVVSDLRLRRLGWILLCVAGLITLGLGGYWWTSFHLHSAEATKPQAQEQKQIQHQAPQRNTIERKSSR